jgi:energy-coupling factor transporter ATP-binding protein EcfA2
MEQSKVRVNRISINNIKSVTSGSIDFNAAPALRQERASVLGIYGQNGSGKTVVIEALAMLKSILSGRQISNRHLESITLGKSSGTIEIEFSIIGGENTDCIAIYKCTLEQRENPNEKSKSLIAVTGENLKVSGFIDGKKYPLQLIAETDEKQNLIRPEQKRKLLFGNDEYTLKKLEQQKIIALYGSRSFIFSNQAAEVILHNCVCDFSSIIEAIRFFAIARLFIVGGEMQSETSLPFNFVAGNEDGSISGQIPFSFESKAILRGDVLTIFESFLPPLNLALASIIQGLSIKHKSQKVSLDKNNDDYEVELFSSRDQGYEFPLRHESLGIKNIISFLSLLIATYNDSGYT